VIAKFLKKGLFMGQQAAGTPGSGCHRSCQEDAFSLRQAVTKTGQQIINNDIRKGVSFAEKQEVN